jgi:hypothetical protein
MTSTTSTYFQRTRSFRRPWAAMPEHRLTLSAR